MVLARLPERQGRRVSEGIEYPTDYDYKIIVPHEPFAQERHRATMIPRSSAGVNIKDVLARLVTELCEGLPDNVATALLRKLKVPRWYDDKYYRKQDLWLSMYDPSAKNKKDWLLMVPRPKRMLTGPLCVDVFLFWPYRKSDCRTGKYAGQLKPGVSPWKDTGKDRDNCDKFVLDSLTGLYWANDSQVADGRIVKRYTTEKPRTEIYITQLERDTK